MAVSLSIDLEVSADCKELNVSQNHNHDGGTVATVTAEVYRDQTKIKSGLGVSVSDVQNNNDLTITTKDTAGTSSKQAFKDGVYQVRLDVTYQSDSTYSAQSRDISYCKAYNCVIGKVAKASEEDCGCEKEQITESADMYRMLQGAIFKFSCGDYVTASDILSKVNSLCEADCGC